MKISIFGMGYVGTTSAACLLDEGHHIVAIDINLSKINNLSCGKTPMIYEEKIEELLLDGYNDGRLKSSINSLDGVVDCDMIWICVGTPSKFDGGIDLSYINTVIKEIGKALKKTPNRPLIVIRSTCLPGTMDNEIIPLLENISKLKNGIDIKIVFHPEFLREGTAVDDFKNPSKIVVGECFGGNADLLFDLYKQHNVPFFRLNFKEAEMVKYCDNLFHAMKTTFANEMGVLSDFIGIDARRIADVYCSDTKLNISTSYLRPGAAYGGSCLPKDLKAIMRFASLNYLQLPLLKGIAESNEKQINNLIKNILSYNVSKIGMVGIAFKKGTNDIRESPYVEIAKSLIGEGIELKIYDPLVNQEFLIGINKEQFYNNFKNVDKMLVNSLDELLSMDLIVINHDIVNCNYIKKLIEKDIKILDVANIKGVDRSIFGYKGIYW